MKINIILPYFPKSPGGGVKVMYEYARHFAMKGHDVVVYHSMQTPYTFLSDESKLSMYWKYMRHFITGRVNKGPGWYNMPSEVRFAEIPYVCNSFVRQADVCFSTWWATAFDIAKLDKSKGKKVNLIQDYEVIMTDKKELVHESYYLNIEHIVISDYLKEILKQQTGKEMPLVKNGIDLEKFVCQSAIEERDPFTVIMLYANHERKGSKYGVEALEKLKQKYPQLKAILFSVDKKPTWMPAWISYHHQPNNLVELYNQSSIFLSPSIQEGFGLPPMEAMACGCACVCSDIRGHAEHSKNEETALLTVPTNVQSIVESIERLLSDNQFRIALAHRGKSNIQTFDWNLSATKMIEIFSQYN
jgi:glycosyltransferase involved in cell wall biosynthesis